MATEQLDTTDRAILEALQRNSSLSNAALAEAVGLSPSPCLRRVRHLEHRGYIRGYHAVLDRQAIGLRVTAFARLNVDWTRAKTLREEIRNLPQVVACYVLTGESGVLLEIVAADLAEYSKFLFGTLYSLTGVRGIQSSVLLELVKDKDASPLPISESEPQAKPAASPRHSKTRYPRSRSVRAGGR
jgi:Lrp/AsnC family transcriptional regulator, leucine-responsive regulatory protein